MNGFNVHPLPKSFESPIKILFTDVDDTLTWNGKLPAETFMALHKLQSEGIQVIPVTGACAGWCDCIIRTWPVSGIIGENGGLWMQNYGHGRVEKFTIKPEPSVQSDLAFLREKADKLMSLFPGISYTQDQVFRLTDIAFDIGQNTTIPAEIADQATQWLISNGISARKSSIHINAWLGNYSKGSTALYWINKKGFSIKDCLFIGDSPNDEAMFESFPDSVGVKNIVNFLNSMKHKPKYITSSNGGYGFVELSEAIIKFKKRFI